MKKRVIKSKRNVKTKKSNRSVSRKKSRMVRRKLTMRARPLLGSGETIRGKPVLYTLKKPIEEKEKINQLESQARKQGYRIQYIKNKSSVIAVIKQKRPPTMRGIGMKLFKDMGTVANMANSGTLDANIKTELKRLSTSNKADQAKAEEIKKLLRKVPSA